MILLIDNYDSFVHNLARFFRRLGQETLVLRNDQLTHHSIVDLCPQAIVLSPGPCTPTEAGCSLDVVRTYYQKIPMLGICLGHQTIAAALGANIIRAPQPMHGRTSMVEHQNSPLFVEIPTPFTACRYHSLIVEASTLPDSLQITATCEENLVMAFQHTQHPVFGVQFHPEAVLTRYGYRLLSNFLTLAGLPTNTEVDELAVNELLTSNPIQPPIIKQPVTF